MNKNPLMRRIKKIHFVGINGTGMGGIAEVLLNEGYLVTGSDINKNSTTEHLIKLGATIYSEHHAKYVEHVDVVVVSAAIPEDNPEILTAKELRIPVVPRAEMLAEIMRFRLGIAVAGTHGKTTTTSLIASLLAEGNLDPTFVIGGSLNSVGSNARLGKGQYLVAEADESDASFLFLKPMMTVITNVDRDHLGTYQDDYSRLEQTFIRFMHHLPFYGLAVVCIDDKGIQKILPQFSRPMITYGFSPNADVRASDFKQQGTQSQFNVHRKDKSLLDVKLNLPGEHNVLNALAAMTIASECGVNDNAICKALAEFQGIGRRFQIHGEVSTPKGEKALLVDDYGHHPREIAATIQAARDAWPDRRLVMVFQPHRYSRTKDLYEDFTQVLSQVDLLVLLEVYAAGESPITGADSRSLSRSIRQRGKVDPIFLTKHENFVDVLNNVIRNNDVVITQGAGSIGRLSLRLLSAER